MTLNDLLAGHQRFQDHFTAQRTFYATLAEVQSPFALWIGCVDSRVVPEQITGAAPGDLLVVRNVANIVPPEGTGNDAVGSAIEFAVGTLRVPHAIICGHTECGGIAALGQSLSQSSEPHLARWVEWARPAASAMSVAASEEARYLETVRANILLQRQNLLTYRPVREAAAAGTLKVHAWLYDLHEGRLWAHDQGADAWRPLVADDRGKDDGEEA